ncbi:PstS family phosphate ABC transporter substrate-binding protein [Myxacorys almedinensis]|uniref:Phosphate-binding protein n=1 Tax=Myxacorys almedinensis A TaxID=2690445 RepID=A0A8J7Z444_9CYAN|nr:PstS family phosphate ABC transporter substrate-binding protein [Myxacorys almedinensis]NDJ18955.1 phosphate ABC transporter substrate-binding protein PstS family protein [Myxacorys almedinensis A]
MQSKTKRFVVGFGALVLVGLLVAVLSPLARSRQQPPPSIVRVDGSSTVFPITSAIAKDYNQNNEKDIQVNVAISGTGGGFKKFCAGETDISNASRPITQDEINACDRADVRYYELPIAFDALTVVVHPNNTWAKDITVEELKKIWQPAAQGKITNWNQIRASYPNQPLRLFGPGRDSGTFDYFTEVTVGQGNSRNDYVASEDDNTLVQGVRQDPNSLGYFGFAYYEANQNQLKALAIDHGKGAVLPSRETVEKAQYQPLSRPLFIYVNYKSAQDKPEVLSFVEFYLKNARQSVSEIGYVPLPDEAYRVADGHFHVGKVGTAFGGKPQPELTIGEVLQKQKVF